MDELLHFPAHFIRISSIGLSVISHDGIDDGDGLFCFKFFEKMLYDFNLFYRAKKTGADSLKGKLQALPVGNIFFHFIGIVIKKIVVKSGMI